MNLKAALSSDIWVNHRIGDTYTMDGKLQPWKIAYFPIFEDGKTGATYDEPRALVEQPILESKKCSGATCYVKTGIDFREVPLRYLTKRIKKVVST